MDLSSFLSLAYSWTKSGPKRELCSPRAPEPFDVWAHKLAMVYFSPGNFGKTKVGGLVSTNHPRYLLCNGDDHIKRSLRSERMEVTLPWSLVKFDHKLEEHASIHVSAKRASNNLFYLFHAIDNSVVRPLSHRSKNDGHYRWVGKLIPLETTLKWFMIHMCRYNKP